MAISHSPVLIAVWVAGWMSVWEVVQIIQLLGESVHGSANTMLARDDNCFWASCSVDRLPPPASSFPIHSKAEASAAFTGNQAKSSNKGVFTPFLRSAKWISVLLYFKISHFLQKLTQHILLARKMWRRRWEVRRLSQHGSPLSGSISRCIPSPATPTTSLHWPAPTWLQQNVQPGLMYSISDPLLSLPFLRKPHCELALPVIYKASNRL